jgi:hypothetical protein
MHTTNDQAPHHRVYEAEGNSEPNPLTILPRWALCPLNWQAHAIDPFADHPLGLWIARCGHQLSGGTPLSDHPQGQPCSSCTKWNQTTEVGQSSDRGI